MNETRKQAIGEAFADQQYERCGVLPPPIQSRPAPLGSLPASLKANDEYAEFGFIFEPPAIKTPSLIGR